MAQSFTAHSLNNKSIEWALAVNVKSCLSEIATDRAHFTYWHPFLLASQLEPLAWD